MNDETLNTVAPGATVTRSETSQRGAASTHHGSADGSGGLAPGSGSTVRASESGAPQRAPEGRSGDHAPEGGSAGAAPAGSSGGRAPVVAPEERIIPKGLRPSRVALGVAVGIVLYGLLYATVETFTYRYGVRNPFFKVATLEPSEPHLLVLGSSRALPLVYDDMNDVVERELGVPVLNLAMEGSGVVPNHLLLDYFLRKHGAANAMGVLYVIDTFAFNATDWNEARLDDVAVWRRAPLDPALAWTLSRATDDLGVANTVFWRYLTGFAKLNDPSAWFEADVWPDEANFDRTYSPSALQDQARLSYLYPEAPDPALRDRYEQHLGSMLHDLSELGVPVLAVSPPLRATFLEAIPDEPANKERLRAFLEGAGVPFVDFAASGYRDDHFLDPDHLNREGVLRFLRTALAPALREHALVPNAGSTASDAR